jgi:hypothetical protein
MAEIVQSLFGVSPEMYQQNQQAMADRQALQLAQLTPFQQANFAIGRGANMLGGAIGGALGGQDPELQRVTARQQIARQIDLTNPESIQEGMAMLQQAGDTVGLQQLAQIFRQQQESGALIAQRTAAAAASTAAAGRERAPPTTNELTNARAIAAAAGPEGSPAYNAAFTSEYQRLTAPKEAKGPAFGADAERASKALYDKPFADLTPTQAAVVNKQLEDQGLGRARAAAPSFTLPGQKALVDVPGFRAKVQSTIEPQSKAVFSADNALANIGDAITSGNPSSYRAAQVQFAKAIAGAGDLSQKELRAAGADPSLLGGAADYLSTLATSTPTKDTMEKMRKALETIKRVNTKKATDEITRQRKIAERSGGYDPVALDLALDFPEFQTAPVAPQYATNPQTKERIMSTDGGKTWTPVR